MSNPKYPQYPSANEGDGYAAPQDSQGPTQYDEYQQGGGGYGQSQQAYQQGDAQRGQSPYGQPQYDQSQQPYQQAYPQPYQQGGQPDQFGQPAFRPTDGFSIASLVTSLLGFNVIAVVLGIVGLNRTKNGAMGGRGMAIAGIVIGSLSLIAFVILMIMYFSLVGASYNW